MVCYRCKLLIIRARAFELEPEPAQGSLRWVGGWLRATTAAVSQQKMSETKILIIRSGWFDAEIKKSLEEENQHLTNKLENENFEFGREVAAAQWLRLRFSPLIIA